jgi:hypothetical protein
MQELSSAEIEAVVGGLLAGVRLPPDGSSEPAPGTVDPDGYVWGKWN